MKLYLPLVLLLAIVLHVLAASPRPIIASDEEKEDVVVDWEEDTNISVEPLAKARGALRTGTPSRPVRVRPPGSQLSPEEEAELFADDPYFF